MLNQDAFDREGPLGHTEMHGIHSEDIYNLYLTLSIMLDDSPKQVSDDSYFKTRKTLLSLFQGNDIHSSQPNVIPHDSDTHP